MVVMIFMGSFSKGRAARDGHLSPLLIATLVVICCNCGYGLHLVAPSPPIDMIGAMMIVWRIRGKVISMYRVVYDSCAQ